MQICPLSVRVQHKMFYRFGHQQLKIRKLRIIGYSTGIFLFFDKFLSITSRRRSSSPHMETLTKQFAGSMKFAIEKYNTPLSLN